MYYRSVVRIIGNLIAQGRFAGLVDELDVQEYRLMREVERARFAGLVRERFLEVRTLMEWARDEEIERYIGEFFSVISYVCERWVY